MKRVGITFTTEEWEELERLAAEELRTPKAQVQWLVREALKEAETTREAWTVRDLLREQTEKMRDEAPQPVGGWLTTAAPLPGTGADVTYGVS